MVHAISSSYNNVIPNVLCKYSYITLKKVVQLGWPRPQASGVDSKPQGGPQMSIWPILTDDRPPLNFAGTFWTSCIHSPLSLKNYQVINLKSLWCSSLPHSRVSLKMKPIQRTEPGDWEKWHSPKHVHYWIQLCLKSVLFRTFQILFHLTQWQRENRFLSCAIEES